ncbi:MAG: hypothetical protein AAF431_10345 [Pseudomonadota bacterium]
MILQNNNPRLRLITVLVTCLVLSACGSKKRNVALKLHSDPLGAYALMQIKYKGDENPEWIFLGPTPVVGNKELKMDGAKSVSLKVIRPGFYEQVKTWKAKDFIKEYRKNKQIIWVPNMVKQ